MIKKQKKKYIYTYNFFKCRFLYDFRNFTIEQEYISPKNMKQKFKKKLKKRKFSNTCIIDLYTELNKIFKHTNKNTDKPIRT